jgi:glyceraldehyde 3-phosphate dehydrogenase
VSVRIGINGLGRIGRGLLRALLRDGRHQIAAVNDVAEGRILAHLLNHDSYYGGTGLEAHAGGGYLSAGGVSIPLFCHPHPEGIPWDDAGADWVVEATGRFKDRVGLASHRRPVLLTASSPAADRQVVFGVNHQEILPAERILSATSCTTHCVVPPLWALASRFALDSVLFNTVHCYNVSQTLVDAPQKDLRRARAAGLNLIPTTTSASLAVESVLPGLSGKVSGMAVRVPAPAVSLTEITLCLERPAASEEIVACLEQAAEGPLRGILALSREELVSQDFLGHPASSVIDVGLTQAQGRMVRIVAWYDNEFGYIRRLVDLLAFLEGGTP